MQLLEVRIFLVDTEGELDQCASTIGDGLVHSPWTHGGDAGGAGHLIQHSGKIGGGVNQRAV